MIVGGSCAFLHHVLEVLHVTFSSPISTLWSLHISAVQDGSYQLSAPQSCPDTASYPCHSFLVSLFGPKGSSAETALVSDLAWDYLTYFRMIVLELC